jgi:hypothetical protein
VSHERRIYPRRVVDYPCWFGADNNTSLIQGRVCDVSRGGARVSCATHFQLPAVVDLYMAETGKIGRRCKVVWNSCGEFGLMFLEATTSLREAAVRPTGHRHRQAPQTRLLADATNVSRPLDNFRLLHTRKIEDVREALTKVHAQPTLEPGRRVKTLDAVVNVCELRHVALGYSGYGADLRLRFPTIDTVVELFPIRGQGEITSHKSSIRMAAGTSAVILPGMGYAANYGADYDFLALRIDTAALARKLEALTGASVNKPLRLQEPLGSSLGLGDALRQYVPLLANTLSAAKSPIPGWWSALVEELLMTMFLWGHQHNYSHLLQTDTPDVASRQVRQAEEYIEANSRDAITLEKLADVTEVSGVSLSRSFKKRRGHSPHQFIAKTRKKGMH